MDTANTTAATTTGNTATTGREAAYAEAAKLKPTRYTSDPDVINSPEESAKVQALWTIYFRAMDAALVKYPYTEEEKAQRRLCKTDS
jgi:hypothetical protein